MTPSDCRAPEDATGTTAGSRWRRFRLHALAISTSACLIGLASSANPASAATSCAAGSSLYIVAHQDDSIFFQNPDLSQDIQAGRCVMSVFLTAGDAGLSTSYWTNREHGPEAAYANMAGVANTWGVTDAGVPGTPIRRESLVGSPRVSLVFLRLPDGGWPPSDAAHNPFFAAGFARSGREFVGSG